MAEARLQNELLEARKEIKRLRDSMSVEVPTLHKDMSFITLVPKWTGSDSSYLRRIPAQRRSYRANRTMARQ
jgi:hypothetical protein